MKRNHIFSLSKRVFCLLLMFLLAADCLLLPAHAAFKSEKEILKLFPAVDSARYDDTKFLLPHKEMALFVGNTLADHGFLVDVIYDDEDSTDTWKEYILMCTEENSKDTKFLPLGVNMTLNQKEAVQVLTVNLLTSQWNDSQIKKVLPAMTAIYDGLHGSMTDEMRRNFVTDGNTMEKEDGYTAYGVFDRLYYELSFSEAEVSFLVTPQPGQNQRPIARYYTEPYTLYGADGYTIRTGNLSRNAQGDILLEVDLINESKNPLLFHMTHVLAGGYDVAEMIYTEVSPGNTKTEQIHVNAALLASAGVESLMDMGLFFRVEDQKTGEVIFNYRDFVPLGMDIQADYHKYSTTLFQNEDFRLSVTGSGMIPAGSTPEIYLMLENGVYGDVLLETEGNCVVGKQEYDLYAYGRVSGYSEGLALVQPAIHKLGKTTKVEFNLQISSSNYNPMVAGHVTITLDSEGKILKATASMKETAQYANILEKEY